MDHTTILSHLGGALVVLTTIHAQDFADEDGDRACGRETMPIVIPMGSRIVMFFGLIGWSIALSWFWRYDLCISSLFILSGIAIAFRYVFLYTHPENKRSYLYYNVSPPVKYSTHSLIDVA